MPQEAPASPIGRDTPRIDGPLKVTGVARYAADFNFPGLLYAVPVEATIALSIVLLAVELVRLQRGEERWIARWPWTVAFLFGLLHGLGFAGALAEIGLPRGDVPLALFAFNGGVELGQLAFIAAVLGLYGLAKRVERTAPLGAWVRPAAPYAIGILASFWFFQRLASFWA